MSATFFIMLVCVIIDIYSFNFIWKLNRILLICVLDQNAAQIKGKRILRKYDN